MHSVAKKNAAPRIDITVLILFSSVISFVRSGVGDVNINKEASATVRLI